MFINFKDLGKKLSEMDPIDDKGMKINGNVLQREEFVIRGKDISPPRSAVFCDPVTGGKADCILNSVWEDKNTLEPIGEDLKAIGKFDMVLFNGDSQIDPDGQMAYFPRDDEVIRCRKMKESVYVEKEDKVVPELWLSCSPVPPQAVTEFSRILKKKLK